MRPSELEARLSLIETNFAKLGETQTDSEREEIEELYCEIKAKLLECLERTGRRVEGADVLSSTIIQRSSKLPKLQVPEFSGKITQWTSWFNTFLTVVGSDSGLDDLSKFIYLKSALGPSPLATIECLELTATNYHRALGLLKDRFENKATILQSHVTELFSLKRLKQADSAQLRALVDSVNAQLASLKTMGTQPEILEAIISHLVCSKLDDETIEKWEDDPDSLEIPSWTTLSQFLIKRGLESIDMLLGVAMFFKVMIVGQIQLGPNWPTLQKSLLGWVVVGDFTPSTSVSLLVQECNPRNDTSVKLEKIIQEFWKCEEIPAPIENLTEDEKRCEEKFIANIRQAESGHFIVKLPFKDSGEKLGDTYAIALSRFSNLERKLNRNLALKEQYQNFIEEYRKLGHLEEMAPEDVRKVKYFMPHHPVIRPESLTTKLRVVFDASCKSSNGVSLNDTLYALTADIAKMYRQVLIHESHRNYQCILWRNDSDKPVHVLRLKTVTYGTSAAPFLAVRCLTHLADMHAVQYPIACAAIRRCFYMDDMLCGSDTISGLISLKQEVSELLAKGGFELHKWRSNWGKVLTDNSVSETLSLKTEEASKALGICWSSVDDEFRFSYSAEVSQVVTKRAVLSELAQVFDPLGFLSPVVILGKIFLQELWLLKQELDTLVLISEDNTPPGQWLLGRVEELHPGKDGAVRVATTVDWLEGASKAGNMFTPVINSCL
ncbi:hypothetical protein ACLKA7_007989 [Drosophila subpalustris]